MSQVIPRATGQLWQMAYESFHKKNKALSVAAVFGAAPASKQVGYRLMKHISALRSAEDYRDQGMVDVIFADVMLSETMGWMTKEVSQKMQDLLQMTGEK